MPEGFEEQSGTFAFLFCLISLRLQYVDHIGVYKYIFAPTVRRSHWSVQVYLCAYRT